MLFPHGNMCDLIRGRFAVACFKSQSWHGAPSLMRTAATLLLMSAIVRSGPADEKPSVPKSGNQIVVYKLKHVTAAKAAEHLKRELSKDATLAGIVILPEEATNTLLVAAPREKA